MAKDSTTTDKQSWRCLCLSCRRTFIIQTTESSIVVCPGCRQEFGRTERNYNYDYPYAGYRKHKRLLPRKKKDDKLPDTYFKGTVEYCIVPWIRNPQPQIIPDLEFHQYYEDMKARIKSYG
jgi:hypothetical protein